jgi:protein-tyrosine phosphatase
MRADALDGLSERGWRCLWEHGVRTIIDLRNDDERPPAPPLRPAGLRTLELPLDGVEQRDFWSVWGSGPQFATPLYYRAHLQAMPERTAAVVAAVARAGDGGVVVHCQSGRDRTGQVAMAILALVGVPAEEVAADYALSAERLRARQVARGQQDPGERIEAFMRDRGESAGEAIASTLREADLEGCLLGAGLEPEDLLALRARLLVAA